MRIFYRRFFETKDEAEAYRIAQGFGKIYEENGDRMSHINFRIEAAAAGMTIAQCAEKPFCVAWNRKVN